MIALDEAQQAVLERCRPLSPLRVRAADAVGRVLAENVMAAEDVPPFDNSAVDGYAVVASDLAPGVAELDVVGEVAAGSSTGTAVAPGATVRIMTGAPIPAGADAVVMVEDSERLDGERVRLRAQPAVGAAIRPTGSDVRTGDRLFEAGQVVTPAVVGVLASVNAREVDVFPAARVAVLSTGDELVTDGAPLAPGQIRESNLQMLSSLLVQAGCDVTELGVVGDDEVTLERVLREAAVSHDAIVSSGGVSMGDYDVVKAVLGRIADMAWMQVAIRPAKPFAIGSIADTVVFGLPGNPVSSLVSFELLARPGLRRMMGFLRLARTSLVAVADEPITRRRDGKLHLDRVRGHFADDGRYHVIGVGAQGSHQLAATALADALAVVPDGDGIDAGDEVAVLLLHD